jgi:hypothetical protein
MTREPFDAVLQNYSAAPQHAMGSEQFWERVTLMGRIPKRMIKPVRAADSSVCIERPKLVLNNSALNYIYQEVQHGNTTATSEGD